MTLKRANKEAQDFIILQKLMRKDNLRRPDFEHPKLKTRSLSDIAERTKDAIPHSTLIKRLDGLVLDGMVEKRDTGKQTHARKQIFEYSITMFGFVRLISQSSNKRMTDCVRSGLGYFFPKLENNLDLLMKMFSEKQIIDTLIHVCKKTEISHGVFSEKDAKQHGEKFMGVTAYELLKSKTSVSVFLIEMELETVIGKVKIERRHSVTDADKFQVANIFHEFSELITAAWYHQTYIRCNKEIDYGYPKEGVVLVSNIVRQWLNLKESWDALLDEVEKSYHKEKLLFDEMKKL